MNEHFLHTFKNLANLYIDKIIIGNNSRQDILNFFNLFFEEAFSLGKIDRLCKIRSCAGNKFFKTSLSAFSFRSGIELKIINDLNLTNYDAHILSSVILGNPYFVRKLISFGYDTLVISTSTTGITLTLNLNDFTNINKKLIK